MQTKQTKLKYMLPRAENILRLVASNIIRNLRDGNPEEDKGTIGQSEILHIGL